MHAVIVALVFARGREEGEASPRQREEMQVQTDGILRPAGKAHIIRRISRPFDERDPKPRLFPVEQRRLFFVQWKWMIHEQDLLYLYYSIIAELKNSSSAPSR